MLKKCVFFILASLFLENYAESSDSKFTIVFVHLGAELPEHLNYSLMQCRLFNDCRIVLIANKQAIHKNKNVLEKINIEAMPCENLKKSSQHMKFKRFSPLDRKFRNGFWYYASERFFYLDDFIQEYQITNVVHLESDVMIYCSLSDISKSLLKNYSGFGVTFDSDTRCIPSFVFISRPEYSSSLTTFMANSLGDNDMYVIGKFRDFTGGLIVKNLPIIHDEYVKLYPINSLNPEVFSNLVDEFASIFDAAYHGQYLGGIDPRNGLSRPGFINETCVINPSMLKYTWEKDNKNRLIPFATISGKKLRINNLHIHSKQLKNFYSLSEK